MNVTIIGTGYVGLVSAASFAHKGFKVKCVDKREDVVHKIMSGVPPFYEKGLEEILKAAIAKKTLIATTDLFSALEGADVIFIAVGTPDINGSIDLTEIKNVSKSIGEFLKTSKTYTVIVVKSTVVPLTTDSVVMPIIEDISGKSCGKDFGLCMNPEFLREANAVEDFLNPDRIVIGSSDERSAETLKKLYKDFSAPIVVTTRRSAEMIKYASNALFATLISFTNEMANIASSVEGVDISEVMAAVCLDHRLNPRVEGGERLNPEALKYLQAGCGFGGSCFPKDLLALKKFAEERFIAAPILDAVNETNRKQPLKIIELLESVYPDIKGKNISVLGLAFKPDTDDTRQSPAITVINRLIEGGANVRAYDPMVKKEFDSHIKKNGSVFYARSLEDAVRGSDCCILITRWPEFESISEEKLKTLMRRPLVIDGRRMLDRSAFNKNTYLGIGYGC